MTLLSEKLRDASLTPRLQAMAQIEESDVAAALGSFQVKVWIGFGFGPGIGSGSEEGIVAGLEQQGGDGDVREELPRAGFCPVILGVAEAVQRARVAVVELLEAAHRACTAGVDDVGEEGGLGLDLVDQRDDEAAQVDAIAAMLVELACAGGEVDRRADRCG